MGKSFPLFEQEYGTIRRMNYEGGNRVGFRYKVILSYDGTNYVGFQVQENGNSIQAELNKALKKMTKGLYIPVCGSGRTDSGVHANGQVIHFDYPTKIEEKNLQRAFNSLLPDDISAREVVAVSDEFHARYSVTGKRYRYRVNIQKFVNPFSLSLIHI